MSDTMRLTVGPVLFNWPAEAWVDFYARIADEAPVDKVVVGEVVCSKRTPFFEDHIPGVVERLQRGGKKVVLASLALLTTVRERKMAAEMFADGALPVEIDDLTALAWARPGFEVGPLINVYNEGTIDFLAKKGATSICLPPELPYAAVATLGAAGAAKGVDIEVWAYGRVPLAISGRCYHARAHGLSKDSCQYVCANDEDGMEVDTLDGEAFLAVNGVQTMSRNYCSVIGDTDALAKANVRSLRLSPHVGDFVEVCRIFRDRVEGRLSAEEGIAKLAANAPGVAFSHGFLMGKSGAERLGA
jgi:O2-independent ubiquinone biosynthesis protein UbiV